MVVWILIKYLNEIIFSNDNQKFQQITNFVKNIILYLEDNVEVIE